MFACLIVFFWQKTRYNVYPFWYLLFLLSLTYFANNKEQILPRIWLCVIASKVNPYVSVSVHLWMYPFNQNHKKVCMHMTIWAWHAFALLLQHPYLVCYGFTFSSIAGRMFNYGTCLPFPYFCNIYNFTYLIFNGFALSPIARRVFHFGASNALPGRAITTIFGCDCVGTWGQEN